MNRGDFLEIGKKLKELRKINKISQKELANRANLSIATIQGYEQNKYKPKIATIEKLANALGVSPSEIAGIEYFDLVADLPKIRKEMTEMSYLEKYFSSLGFSLTKKVIRWHYENEDKEVQIPDELKYTLSKDNQTVILSEKEFNEMQSKTKEVIEGIFYKKLVQNTRK